MQKNTVVEIKGNSFTISVIYINHLDPDIIFKTIKFKLKLMPNFLKNAPVILNIEYLNYKNIEWDRIQHSVLKNNLRIIGVSGCTDQKLKYIIEKNNLPIFTEKKTITSNKYNFCNQHIQFNKNIKSTNKTYLVNKTVRSGQQIYAKNTDLIVINNVNPGAELVADGNIHIYGIMRGKALAGASGNCECQIFCTNLIAELVSIAGEFWMMDQIPIEFFGKSARLCLQENILTIHPLN